MRHFFIGLVFLLFGTASAQADPVLRIINFTADWCSNCQILNPRIDDAMSEYPEGTIELVNLDVTDAGRKADELRKAAAFADAIRLADANKAGYLWDWYGGITGIAVIVAADTGEPISCVMRPLKRKDISARLKLAKILAERAPAGQRKPDGPDCPAPMRN
ncbi:MAG: thioredoxin family protein [Henriciella sp.]|nr:thioredoxin family protein [Henriciella sp.]